MPKNSKFILRKRKRKYDQDTTWINAFRMPHYSSALISLYAYEESVLLPGSRAPKMALYWAIEYYCEGEYLVSQEGRHYHLNPGDILILCPGGQYYRENQGISPVKKKVIMLNNSPLISILHNHSVLNGMAVIRCTDPAAVEAYFDQVRDLIVLPGADEKFERAFPNTIFSLFTELIVQCGKNNISNSFEDQLKQLNMFAPDLTLEQMAEHFKTGKRTLSRMFVKQLNLSPIQYVISMRMKYAAQLLRSNNLSIREIAEECGYRDTSFFIAEFKKYFQKTPLEFRNSKDIFNNRKVHLLDGWNRKRKKNI